MQYVLKTGFGESLDSYGGTIIAPNSGLGQGSDASHLGSLALSSLIVNAYRRMGHGAKILSLYTQRLFHLTAVMNVDDTNLLHWPGTSSIDSNKLIAAMQCATTDYGRLAIASGGVLKQNECSLYIFDYIFVPGQAKMRSLHGLLAPCCYIPKGNLMLPLHITIPQPMGPDLPIITHDVKTTSKMLACTFLWRETPPLM